jgi:hypothetical protein
MGEAVLTPQLPSSQDLDKEAAISVEREMTSLRPAVIPVAAPAACHSSEPSRPWFGRLRRQYAPRGLFTGAALALFALLALLGVWIVPGLLDSIEQRRLHRAAVHSDATTVQTGIDASIKMPTTLVYRDVNGTLHRMLTDETEVTRFVIETLIYLDS